MNVLTYFLSFAYFLTLPISFAADPKSISEKNTNSESRIAAVVNDKSILLRDLEHRLNFTIKTSNMNVSPETRKSLRNRLLQQMIDEELQRQLAKKYEIEINTAAVESAWSSMEKRFNMGQGQLKEFLKSNKIPERIIQDQLKASWVWHTYIQERYRNLVQVTKDDEKQEMARIQSEKNRDQALISEIVLNVKAPEESDKVRQQANQLAAKVRSGSPFPLIAQQFSHSASAANGGDIGWVNVDQLDSPIKEKVKHMKRGEISEPIEVKGTYKIIGMRDRQGIGSLGDPIEYVSFQQIEFTFPMFGDESAMEETFLNATRVRSVGKSCSLMKKMTTDRPRIKNQFVERRRIEELHPELASLLRKLKPGERSDLMNTGQGFIMFMLCNREVVQPHEPDEDEIKNSLMEKKLGLVADRELRNLRRGSLIDIRI